MTQEELKLLMNQIKEAEGDVTPFPVVQENEIAVVGDANKTEIKKTTFTITFAMPKENDGKIEYERHVVTYKDVYPKPRQMVSIDRLIALLGPYLKRPNDDGTVSDYTEEENAKIIKAFDEDITSIMYQLVATVIGIDSSLIDYMLPSSVFENLMKIIRFYPELWNEGDTFFG